MLKKLQRKIILTNMLLVGIVLLVVFAFFCYNTHRVERGRVNETLNRSFHMIEQELQMSDFQDEIFLGPSAPFFGIGLRVRPEPPDNSMVLRIQWDGDASHYTLLSQKGLSYSEEEAAALAERVWQEGSQIEAADYRGELSEEELYYRLSPVQGEYYLAFAGGSRVKEETREAILTSLVLFLVLMSLFFLISLVMARYAVRPVKESWDKQQRFLADASHELKTPLTVLLANNNILLSQGHSLSEEDRGWVESSQEEAVHMHALVEQLLFLAREDSGEQRILPEDLDLSELVEEDVLQFEPLAFERGITIDTEIEAQLHLQGDGTMLKQLVHILLDNACKYAAADSCIRVRLVDEGSAGGGKPGKGGIRLEVQNRGEPIPAEDLPHLFERFYRGDKARTHDAEASGYGLGLAIAQAIAEEHGGSISCRSTAEDGTCFTVFFKR